MPRFIPTHATDVAVPTAHVILTALDGAVVSAANPTQFREVTERVYTAIQVYCEFPAPGPYPRDPSND